eukprot:scaffold53369_cov29-Phaeocystis_antarctica.AAC.1
MPRDVVLYYDPMSAASGMVVLATEDSLCLAREFGQLAAAMDCKHDTTRDCRSMYSSMRVPSPWGWFLVAVWISSVENTSTIEVALRAIADNVPCSDPACCHTVSGRWADGIYRRWRCCARTFKPHVGTDKHSPSCTAINAAGYGGAVLDPFHGYRAFDEDSGQTAAGRLYNCPAEDEMWTALQKAIDDADYECAQDAPEDEGSGEEEPDDGES